jgi:hypothetical protein
MKCQRTFLFFFFLVFLFPSCKSKKEAKELFSLFSETEILYKNSDDYRKNEFRKLEKFVVDGGNRPQDTLIFYKTKNINTGFIEIQTSIGNYMDTVFYKKLDKDYNYFDFDTLGLLNALSPDKEYFKRIQVQLQKTIQDYGNESLQKLLTKRKRKFQFLEFHENTVFLKLPEEKTKAGVLLLTLSSLRLEISELRGVILTRQSERLDHTMHFDDLRPIVRVIKNVLDEGEEYKAEVFFAALGHTTDQGLSMKANGAAIPVNNDIGEVKFIATPGPYDSKGLTKKSWEGEINFSYRGIDTVFKVRSEYYVKRKCNAN